MRIPPLRFLLPDLVIIVIIVIIFYTLVSEICLFRDHKFWRAWTRLTDYRMPFLAMQWLQ